MDSSRRILVVDGSAQRGADVAAALRMSGWEPILTRDSMLAFAVALKQRPAAVIMRDQVAGGGAPAAIAKLRNSVHTARVHVIVVGCEGGRREADLLAAGAQACLPRDASAGALAAAADSAATPAGPPLLAPRSVIAQPDRLDAVGRYMHAADAPDSLLHDLTRLAVLLLGTSASMLTLVTGDRQVFIAQTGLATGTPLDRETPLSHSFCQWVVSGREPVLIDDARRHDVLHANEAIDALGVISYAGVPISAGEQHTLGSFCATDPDPREWSAEDLLVMKSLAKMVEAALVAAVPRSATAGREFVVMGQGVSAAGSLLRRVADRKPEAAPHVLRFLERQSQELMVHALGWGRGASR